MLRLEVDAEACCWRVMAGKVVIAAGDLSASGNLLVDVQGMTDVLRFRKCADPETVSA